MKNSYFLHFFLRIFCSRDRACPGNIEDVFGMVAEVARHHLVYLPSFWWSRNRRALSVTKIVRIPFFTFSYRPGSKEYFDSVYFRVSSYWKININTSRIRMTFIEMNSSFTIPG